LGGCQQERMYAKFHHVVKIPESLFHKILENLVGVRGKDGRTDRRKKHS